MSYSALENQAFRKQQILKTYGVSVDSATEDALIKSEENDIQKGKPAMPVGTKKEIGGRMYIKTLDGWKYYGKGGGTKAKEYGGGGKSSKASPKAEKPSHDDDEDEPKAAGKEDLKTKLETSEKRSFDIDKRFAAFETFTKAVITGKSKSLIAYGSGGVGKTYTVTRELDRANKVGFDEDKHQPGVEGYDYVKITGKATPTAVYKALFQHNGKTILFDDCDSVLQNEDAINLFKGALDSSGDGTISYGSAKKIKDDDGEEIPQRFKFNGRVIFISNLSSDQMPQPLKSRALRVDLTMDRDQTIQRIKSIATNKEGKFQNLKFPGVDKYSHQDLKDVFDYLDKHKDDISDLNVRTVGSMLVIKQMADAAGESDWREQADHMIFSKSQNMDIFNGSELMKARRQNMLKSYGIDPDKARIEKSEDIKSHEHVENASDHDEEEGDAPEMEKSFTPTGNELVDQSFELLLKGLPSDELEKGGEGKGR